MKLSRHVIALALCSLLAACGGGGEDDGSTVPASLLDRVSRSEFVGTWLVLPENAGCVADFPYKALSFHRFKSLVLADTDGALRASVTADVFSDAACTTKLGMVEEQYLLDARPGAATGRTNVVKATFRFTGFRMGADGGSGLAVNRLPDGSMSDMVGHRFLIDRDGDRLYLTHSSNGAARDIDGYPTAFGPGDFMVRRPTGA